MDIGGLETEADYGYDGEDEACQFNRSKVAVRVSGGLEISQDEVEMAKWLVKNGPISIALNAFAMQFYMGGVRGEEWYDPPRSATPSPSSAPRAASTMASSLSALASTPPSSSSHYSCS